MRGRHSTSTTLLAFALLLGIPRSAYGAGDLPVNVKIEGVEGDVRHNVLETLSITKQKGRVPEGDVHDLHAKTPDEIRKAMEPYGFYRPAIQASLERKGKEWEARYTIAPGPPMLVDSLDIEVTGEGSTDRNFKRVVGRFPLHQGDALLHSAYENGKSMFVTAAVRHGYLDGSFLRSEMVIDLDRYRSAVVIHYDTGPLYRFGPVVFHQDVVNPELLQGYITFKEGDPIDFNKLLELEEALGNSPYFSRVEVKPDRAAADGNKLPIIVDLVPAKPQKLTLGVGYGTDNGPHTRSLAEFRRINRRGHRGEIEGTLSTVEQSAAAKYIMPWPYPRSDVLTASGGYSRKEINNVEERVAFSGLSLGRMWAGWQETFALNFRREHFKVGLDEGLENFLTPEGNWSHLRTDDPIDPRNGRRLRFRVSGAHEKVLSGASYATLEGGAKWMRSFYRRNRLTGRIDAGYTWTKDFHRLPPSVRFFAGGAQSVRGFEFNHLGPRDATGTVIGGEALGTASFEYEYRFMRKWGAAVFYDVGNAMTSFKEPLEHGAGAGVRWVSPVGLIRIDVGIPLTETPHRPKLHLSIGPGL